VRVAASLGIDADVVPITADTWRRTVVSSVHEYEYAYGGGTVPISALARRALADGCKVVLTGEGSDELFGGYGLNPGWRSAWSLLPRAKRPRWALEQVRAIGLISVRARLRERFGPHVPALLPDAARRGDAVREETLDAARRAYGHHEGARRELEAAMLTALTAGTLSGLLNRMDKNAMGASVEARVPYLDRDVISLVVNLPAEARIGPPPKRVLRGVAARYLPHALTNRPKQAGTPIDVRGHLAPADPDFLDQGRMRDMYEVPLDRWRHALARASPAVFTRLWFAEIWCRLFLEGQDVRAVEDALWPAGVDA
jgi:asparagine synthase (glutamine-hydrolysing)